jgi:putative FmdB family regulatory protein
MPIYEYACDNCGHVFDALQKMSDDPLTDCPACGEPRLKKLLSAPNFRLKGGGWYETDFKKDKRRNIADGAGDKSSGSEAGKGDKKDVDKKTDKKSAPEKSSKGPSSAKAD